MNYHSNYLEDRILNALADKLAKPLMRVELEHQDIAMMQSVEAKVRYIRHTIGLDDHDTRLLNSDLLIRVRMTLNQLEVEREVKQRQRQEKNRLRMRKHRLVNRKPNSRQPLSTSRPWENDGVSRATWFRNRSKETVS